MNWLEPMQNYAVWVAARKYEEERVEALLCLKTNSLDKFVNLLLVNTGSAQQANTSSRDGHEITTRA